MGARIRIDVVTIFPEMFAPVLGASMLSRAQAKRLVDIRVHNLRDFTHDKRRTVDDRPFGGGPGMVMKPEPIAEALEVIEADAHGKASRTRKMCEIVLLSPAGEPLTQAVAQTLSTRRHLVLICGHYEGVDARVRELLADRELSIGDYVLTGGELPAMVVLDSVARLVPGVLGHAEAAAQDSFSEGLLEFPQYTRPVTFRGSEVPEVLRAGNHRQIATWRRAQSMAKTAAQRPDLLRRAA